MSPSSSSSPKMSAASIPNITALRIQLDYGDARLPRCATFNDDTRAFRRKFRTSRGVAGVDLHDWKSRDGQAGLNEMTISYLEKEGSGLLFWPDDPSSPNYNKYQYSRDGQRIRRLVKQLFFRLNQQQFRNHKYKHKETPEPKAVDERGHSEQAPIEVDAIAVSPITKSANEPSVVADDPSTRPFDSGQFLDEQHPSPGRVILNDADVYDVPTSTPQSPSRMPQFQSINQPSGAKRGHTLADPTSKAQQAKRQKRQPKPLPKDDSEPATVKNSTSGKWTSPRIRRQPRREGFCGLDEINKEIASSPEREGPQRASTPESATITFQRTNTDATEAAPPDAPGAQPRLGGKSESSYAPRRPPSPTPTLGAWAATAPVSEARFAPILLSLHNTPQPATHRGESDQPETQPIHPSSDDHSYSKSPTPSSSAAKSAAAAAASGGAGNPSTTTTINKPSVNFTYRVVLTRKPKTVAERWTPRGRFQDKTLAELRKELPFGDDLLTSGEESQGLIFTIESECMRTVERLAYDDEVGFASMKRYVNMEIREWFSRRMRDGAAGGASLDVDMLIERIAGDGGGDEVKGRGGGGLEDLALEW